jgi:hypothetical protein
MRFCKICHDSWWAWLISDTEESQLNGFCDTVESSRFIDFGDIALYVSTLLSGVVDTVEFWLK